MKNLLSLASMSGAEMRDIVNYSHHVKKHRKDTSMKVLEGQTWAMIFSKASTRTRVSFEVGLRELGANVIFLAAGDMQLGRGEPIKDTARVLGRLVHGAIIRTFAQSDVEDFAKYSCIPTINALTDEEHPCQILADIFTFEELRGPITGKKVTFVGDGDCNVPRSWIFAAAKLGFELNIAAPEGFQPPQSLIDQAMKDSVPGAAIRCTPNLHDAVRGVDMIYTDVWISMGKEEEAKHRLQSLQGYQINRQTVSLASPEALVMHCLPAYRGKEITDEIMEANAECIFREAENRLHVQKSILLRLAKD